MNRVVYVDMLSTWNSCDPHEMRKVIEGSGMPLDEDEQRLVRAMCDYDCTPASVYDLHHMNVLCFMSVGYSRGDHGTTK